MGFSCRSSSSLRGSFFIKNRGMTSILYISFTMKAIVNCKLFTRLFGHTEPMRKKITRKASMHGFTVVFESAPEGGYIVHVPSLPGCATQGETLSEAKEN